MENSRQYSCHGEGGFICRGGRSGIRGVVEKESIWWSTLRVSSVHRQVRSFCREGGR